MLLKANIWLILDAFFLNWINLELALFCNLTFVETDFYSLRSLQNEAFHMCTCHKWSLRNSLKRTFLSNKLIQQIDN